MFPFTTKSRVSPFGTHTVASHPVGEHTGVERRDVVKLQSENLGLSGVQQVASSEAAAIQVPLPSILVAMIPGTHAIR